MSEVLFNDILSKLTSYKRKYYFNILLKGTFVFLSLILSTYVFFTFVEYYGRFNSVFRFILFLSFVGLAGFSLVKWIIIPVSHLMNLRKPMSDEEASLQIGKFFPEINDKLLNTLQLKKLSLQENELVLAGINQKSKELSYIPFTDAINLNENRKYLKFLLPVTILILGILVFVPQIFVESTARIINYEKSYIQMPFQFLLKNKSLDAFKNEDLELTLDLDGSAIPENVYIITNGRKSKMKKVNQNQFQFTMKNLQRSEDFFFEAAGFNSDKYRVNLIIRPDLRSFEVALNYPAYLRKKNEQLKNAGNLIIPEGTDVTWNFDTEEAKNLILSFTGEKAEKVELDSEDNEFRYSKKFRNSENYEIQLKNGNSVNKEKISYNISVVKDQYPTIEVEQFRDTVLFNYITFGGTIGDDYGLSALRLFYKISDKENEGKYKGVAIKIEPGRDKQNFYYTWGIDSINLQPGQHIEYYLQVWDNDGVNGSKSTKSKSFNFHLPSKEEMEKEISTSTKQAENKMDQMVSKTMNLQKDIEKLQDRLKTKNNLNFQDKKLLEDVLKKHEEIKKELEELNKLNQSLNEKQEKFNPASEELKQKMEQLQKLMDELLDEETKKLYEELQKLLNEKMNKEDIEKILDEIKKKDETLEKELERTLEMFKQMKFDQKLENIVKDLKETAQKQEELSQKTEDKKEDQSKLQEEQEKLNEEFNKIQEEMKELKDINESLENKKDLNNMDQEQNSIEKEMQNSSEQLKSNQNKKASGSQKNAADKMKEMADKMAQMQQSMEMEQAQENMDDLRDILENLITLSFDQEELMKEFRKVNQTDPRFVTLSQKQLKLKDDSQIIEDSLMALAKRVFQIESFVTREVGAMKGYMDEATDALKDRRPDIATGKQQFAMTSINNLALMLNDVLKQMQEQMANQMQGGQMCKKPGKNQKPGLGEMQKQLNEQIQQLKQSGKSGRELSEELAKLAAKQEMIRNAMKELEKSMQKDGKNPGNQLSKLKEEMEKTETDLVNKKLTQEMMMRQQDILTRLLEAEKAARERELDNKRESTTGKELNREIPPSFEKYLKAREKQVDLLKTVNPALNPYFKQEVNEYFQKIEK